MTYFDYLKAMKESEQTQKCQFTWTNCSFWEPPPPPPKKNPPSPEWINHMWLIFLFLWCNFMYGACVNKIMLWLQVSPAGIPSPVRPCCQATHHYSSRRGLRKGLLCADTGQVQGQCCLQGGTFYFVFKNLCLRKSVSSKIPVRKSVLKNPCLPKNPWARLRLEQSKGCLYYKNKGNEIRVV